MQKTVDLTDFEFDTRHYQWQSLSKANIHIPKPFRLWLNLPGSLTQALKARSAHFNVEVVEQTHLYLSSPLEGFEHQGELQRFFSRKVLLKDGHTPWVAAHTLVPESSLQNGLNQLTKLANKPLGELLFASQGVIKDRLQVCETANGWGRRARFLLQQQPLMVSEYFLPELINYEQNCPTSLP